MPTPTASVKVNPITGALIDPIAATFASANGFLTGGTSDAKESVVCATTANGTLATAFENGDTVDGITLATGNRILIKNQSAPAENGIYTVNASGAPTRATDFDAWTEIVGAFVTVESGTVNAGTQWLCNVVSGGTLGTTAITFVVPKNYVDLTTTQTIGGAKTFSNITGSTITSSTISGITVSNGTGTLNIGDTMVNVAATSLSIGSGFGSTIEINVLGSTNVTLPLSGTLATTTGNVATATALATARNIFNISFNGTANVAGDATNTGHFASIPGTGAAGHFVTENGTAPTLIAGRSAWYSDGSGVPSFKNGTGTAVTLVRSSDIGVSVQAYDADLTTWAGITPGANVGTGILSRPIFATTATAAGTTTFTVTSASTQEFTGSTTQTVTMPVVTTLVAGWATSFINKSTGNVTLNSSGGNAIVVLAGGQSVTLVCKSISADTTAAAWDAVGLSPALWFASKATATLALPDSTDTTVTFPTSIGGNATGWFDGTTITAGLAGYLTFEGVIGVIADSSGDTSANAVNLGVSKNGTTTWIYYESTNFQSAGANDVGFCLPFSHTIACAAGDTFLVRINYADGGTGTVATALRTLKVSFSP